MSKAQIPAGLRAELSQSMAEGAEWADLLLSKFRERVQEAGEAEAVAELYLSLMMLADRDKLITAVMCLVSRLNRVEVSP